MDVFNLYSEYYNLLYRDKDYKAEAEFIAEIVKKYMPDARTVLNLGCGTGKHDFVLASLGFDVVGIDFSEQMLLEAEKERERLHLTNVRFLKNDIRDFALDEKFDVIISLFHVMSYQNNNCDIDNVMKTAAGHLKENGLFIFDFWYGPAVLTQRPSTRIKRMENEICKITRISEPEHICSENLVKVNFDLFITDKKNKQTGQIKEVHSMRYFFEPELDLFLEKNNLDKLQASEWMTENGLSMETWNAVYICKKGNNREQ